MYVVGTLCKLKIMKFYFLNFFYLKNICSGHDLRVIYV